MADKMEKVYKKIDQLNDKIGDTQMNILKLEK